MSLTYDEVVYASQVSTDTPAARFTAPRARGMPLLLAPVVAITEWVFAFRVYLAVISGILMYLAFRPWLAVFGRVGGRYRYVPVIATGFLATLWVTVLYGSLAYPNLWLAFALVAGAGYFCRAVTDPPPDSDLHHRPPQPEIRGLGRFLASIRRERPGRHGWGPLIGVATAFAVASLIRPTDTLAAAGPLLLAALVVRAWRRWLPAAAVAVGLLVGWGAWIVEAYARFGGPLARLREGAGVNSGGFVNSVPEHLYALDGPAVLCRPADLCEGIDPLAAAWWLLLPVVVAIGLLAAYRTRWFWPALLVTGSATAVALSYFLLIDYAAARFLLPSYALLAIPAAGAVLWLTSLGDRKARTIISAATVVGLLLHAGVQQDVLGPVRSRLESSSRAYSEIAEVLHDEGLRQPCLIWGDGSIQLSYLLKCRSVWNPRERVPATDDPDIAAALARGDDVVLRIRADARLPESMADWRRLELPAGRRYVAYVSPG